MIGSTVIAGKMITTMAAKAALPVVAKTVAAPIVIKTVAAPVVIKTMAAPVMIKTAAVVTAKSLGFSFLWPVALLGIGGYGLYQILGQS